MVFPPCDERQRDSTTVATRRISFHVVETNTPAGGRVRVGVKTTTIPVMSPTVQYSSEIVPIYFIGVHRGEQQTAEDGCTREFFFRFFSFFFVFRFVFADKKLAGPHRFIT